MKKLFLALALSAVSFSAVVAQNGMKSEDSELLASRRKSGNRTFGLGLNYTFPASGVSARFGFTDNIKGQVTFGTRSYRSVDFVGRYISIGAELDYCFDEKKGSLGQWYPFAYGSLGSFTYKADYSGVSSIYFNPDDLDQTYSWVGWNIGAGLELFPEFLGGDFGVNWKLGLGSLGNYGYGITNAGVTAGLIYGAGFHYYFK